MEQNVWKKQEEMWLPERTASGRPPGSCSVDQQGGEAGRQAGGRKGSPGLAQESVVQSGEAKCVQ